MARISEGPSKVPADLAPRLHVAGSEADRYTSAPRCEGCDGQQRICPSASCSADVDRAACVS